ncbi:acyl-CoA dehydrogenase family protein [Streptomyces griseocarneus]|uniref:acyl-CoA dehydrogenase family protein n=1 Tax=Streptomyces griseocarneus TaxID=51201 RepID=UPI00167EEB16|nr:acyl-CoA dehydrogenase family protein [Streptomyces griseocarneus]MBZ6474971.1 oxidoreductase [Streptomyces griseocarneus]GHG49197.1 oxidoreductase mmfh [Streptomyces griseocarneus]
MFHSQYAPRRAGREDVAPAVWSPDAAASATTHAARAEEGRRLVPETVRLLTEAGFPRYFVPRARGGTEGTFTDLLTAVAGVADADASAAWCGALWAAHSRFAAYLPPQGQQDLWCRGPDVRLAAAVTPSGSAEPVPGGRMLRGEWECVSGVDFADWALLAARDPQADGQPVRLHAVPRGDFAVRDSWHSTGLRATGSNTVVVCAAYVPDHRSFLVADLMNGASGPGRARCHTVPAHLVGGLIFAASALGAARHALDVWSRWAAVRLRADRAGGRDNPTLHRTLARTAGDVEAAGLLLRSAALRADLGSVTERTVASNRRDAAAATNLLVKGVERLFRTGGVHARNGEGELQRCWRDVHTIAAHSALDPESAANAYAEAVLTEPKEASLVTT